MKIKVGDVLRDNDPRFKGRTVVVVYAGDTYVSYAGKSRWCSIKTRRIFTDGKKRAQGWNLIQPTVRDEEDETAFTFAK